MTSCYIAHISIFFIQGNKYTIYVLKRLFTAFKHCITTVTQMLNKEYDNTIRAIFHLSDPKNDTIVFGAMRVPSYQIQSVQ